MISFQCQCGYQIRLPDEWSGRQVACRKCRNVIMVPASLVPVPAPMISSHPPALEAINPDAAFPQAEVKPSRASFEVKIALALGGVAAAFAVVLLIWFFVFRDSWEQDHYADLVLMSEESVHLIRSGRPADGLRKFEQIQQIVGERQLTNSTLASAIADARAAAAEARRAATRPVAVVTPRQPDPVPIPPVKVAVTTKPVATAPMPELTLAQAKKGFKTVLTHQYRSSELPPDPPAKLFSIVNYPAPLGDNVAYLTPDPKDGKKHPAIVWLTGDTEIDDVWTPPPAGKEDCNASAFRKAGIIMMYPGFRGGNGNPGVVEGYLGEVDDTVAAGEFLAKQPYVDSNRVYLGGHSGGGTIALLASESTDIFRAVFSFGPAHDVSGYIKEAQPPVNMSNKQEIKVRSPVFWLDCVRKPTFILEGRSTGHINILALAAMDNVNKNPLNKFVSVGGASHLSIVAPVTKLIAEKILADTGATTNIDITEEETAKLFEK